MWPINLPPIGSYNEMHRVLISLFVLITIGLLSLNIQSQEIRGGVNSDKFSSKAKAAALVLGDREDAVVWAAGFERITGSNDITILQNQFPTLEELVAFFALQPDWLFVGGHSDGSMISNGVASDDPNPERIQIGIYIQKDRVTIVRGKERVVLHKGKEFMLNQSLDYVFWGGCWAHNKDHRTEKMLNAFSTSGTRPVSFGWTGKTGWEVTHAIMGGFGNEEPFASLSYFDRLMLNRSERVLTDRDMIECWMESIIQTDWGEEYPIASSVSVIDSFGDEWVIEQDRTVKSIRPWTDLGLKGKQERSEIRRIQRERAASNLPTSDNEEIESKASQEEKEE